MANSGDTNENINEMEALTKLDQRYVFFMTGALKLTLDELARSRHVSMADVVRNALPLGLAIAYPDFENIYRKHLTRMTGDL